MFLLLPMLTVKAAIKSRAKKNSLNVKPAILKNSSALHHYLHIERAAKPAALLFFY
jgi:hypothetical protein